MVKHIILWTLKEMPEDEKALVKKGIKEGLEGLKGKIPGLIDIKVATVERLGSSTADVMLDSTFDSKESLEGYSKHPEHVAVANEKVRPFTATRSCMDFELPINIGEIKVAYPDCCFMVGKDWFRYRTGALIVENGCLLAITNPTSPHYYSVGGGVHMNETAEECIVREVKEETGVDYEIDHLAVVCENFFIGHEPAFEGLNCHVLEFYYLMKSRGTQELKSESYGYNGAKESITWIPLEDLPNANIKPDFLKTRIPEILKSNQPIHIVNDERG